jgi:hypothetical protein
MIATCLNNKVETIVSPIPDPIAISVSAMTMTLTGIFGYASPQSDSCTKFFAKYRKTNTGSLLLHQIDQDNLPL